jgi:hypothetical protein
MMNDRPSMRLGRDLWRAARGALEPAFSLQIADQAGSGRQMADDSTGFRRYASVVVFVVGFSRF